MIKRIGAIFSLGLLTLGAMVGIQSCDDKIELSNFVVNVRFAPNGETFTTGETYMINGTAVEFNVLRFYMSGIGLQNSAGQNVLTTSYVLANPGQTRYEIGQVISQEYTGVTFNVGIDSFINHLDPSQYVSQSVLSPQFPSVHWGWDPGYIFIRIDAMYDSDGDDVPDTGMEVHFGTDQFLRNIVIPGNIDATDKEEVEVSIDFDPIKLFTSVDFPTVNTTHVGDDIDFANAVADNVESAFSIN
ncbi:MAG: hypothetical protein ACI959_001267 [Limisphaerales bacterium]|jgi:hypothetical protein